MIALRALIAMSALKMKVATGCVAGIRPTTTPTGLAISAIWRSLSKLISPYPTFPSSCGGDAQAGDGVLERLVVDIADAGFLHRRGGQRLSAFGNALTQRPK